jgi:hypothetical protein
MIHNNDSWLRSFILQYLEQIEYWHVRFELSRDIEHLDNAERFADAIRSYLPNPFKELNIIGLRNLYWSLSATTNSNKKKDVLDDTKYI